MPLGVLGAQAPGALVPVGQIGFAAALPEMAKPGAWKMGGLCSGSETVRWLHFSVAVATDTGRYTARRMQQVRAGFERASGGAVVMGVGVLA